MTFSAGAFMLIKLNQTYFAMIQTKQYIVGGLLLCGLLLSCKQETYDKQLEVLEYIRLNQLGFYPNGPKKAVMVDVEGADTFFVVNESNNQVVYKGNLSGEKSSSFSERITRIADFSDLSASGNFRLVLPDIGQSYPFTIDPSVHRNLTKGAVKAFYYQRMSTELLPEHAGAWARPRAHPDDQVKVHASAASDERPEGTLISAPKGWYDAGDYNKYIVNSGITMGTLLATYEDFPSFAKSLDIDIPESGNDIPDLLDEILWNLEWMLTMQDPHDGGVYHKLTTAKFEGRVMPHQATSQRYVVAKSTAATLDFAAVMAQAHRVYQEFMPDLANRCLEVALKAWDWAEKHPDVLYRQNEMNERYKPEVTTGAYGDNELADEWNWAACELYVSTRDDRFLSHIELDNIAFQLPAWRTVGWMGYYTLLRFKDKLNDFPPEKMDNIQQVLLQQADDYVRHAKEINPYQVVMGQDVKDFVWGSNSVAANQGIALIQAYLLTQQQDYLYMALANLDYIMGRNATGYSYVTGFGHKTPQDPHHRPSGAEPDKAPVPGLMVGGPNPGQQDDCDYESKVPDESYVDDYCSYASNEIAINWSAPFAYLTFAIESIKGGKGH